MPEACGPSELWNKDGAHQVKATLIAVYEPLIFSRNNIFVTINSLSLMSFK